MSGDGGGGDMQAGAYKVKQHSVTCWTHADAHHTASHESPARWLGAREGQEGGVSRSVARWGPAPPPPTPSQQPLTRCCLGAQCLDLLRDVPQALSTYHVQGLEGGAGVRVWRRVSCTACWCSAARSSSTRCSLRCSWSLGLLTRASPAAAPSRRACRLHRDMQSRRGAEGEQVQGVAGCKRVTRFLNSPSVFPARTIFHGGRRGRARRGHPGARHAPRLPRALPSQRGRGSTGAVTPHTAPPRAAGHPSTSATQGIVQDVPSR